MRPHLTRAGLAASKAAPPAPPRFLFKVTVTLAGGEKVCFEGVYAHAFDVYDSAFNQFPGCERVEAKAVALKAVHGSGGRVQ